jgi:uncharacterized protein (TIGR02246 family)
MKPIFSFCAATVIALFVTACHQTLSSNDADVKAIQDTESQWNQDFAARDLEKIAGHYTDDAVFMVSGSSANFGKDAIRNGFRDMVSDPGMTMKFQATKVDVAKSGDLAYTRGTYTLTVTDPQSKQIVTDHGSYVTTYRKQADGTWKAVADIAVSEVPPPPAPTPASTPAP